VEGLYRFLRAEADRHGGRYEDAMRNYEVLLKLTQWAGFRDRALFGIADTYTRMGDEDKALTWLASLKESFPGYFEKQKLADYQKELETRRDRKKKPAPASTDPVRDSFVTGFEPGEKVSFGDPSGFVVVPALGIVGPHVGLVDNYPEYRTHANYSRPLHGLSQNGSYWVEIWYRDTLGWGPPTAGPYAQAWLAGDGGSNGVGQYNFERTLGRWRKLSFNLKGPSSADGKLNLALLNIYGVPELDGLSVRPVSDREHDSLANFLEGPTTP
jgi:hypothetical protein